MNKKSIKIFICILTAAVLAACVVLSIIFSAHRQFNASLTENTVFSNASAGDNATLKSHPLAASFTKEKIEKGSQIKVLSAGEEWCKAVVFSNNTVEEGYIQTDKITNLSAGVILASTLNFDKSEITATVGDTVTIGISITPVYSNEQIIWNSSDENIASVSDGTVTILASGEVQITAKTSQCSAEVKITAVDSPDKIEFKKSTLIVDAGTSTNIKNYLVCEPKSSKIKWKSSDENVIKVEGGKVTAVSEGKASVFAICGVKQAECKIEVRSIDDHSSGALTLPNAYGNKGNYHPSVLSFDDGWNGYKYWMAFTPYEKCNDIWENPHILASNDLKNWQVPKGFKNPLEPVPDDYEHGKVYNSDTELVYNTDTGKLECWWRFYSKTEKAVKLMRKTTSDGVHWSSKEVMLVAPMGEFDCLSPALLYENGKYMMWSIDLWNNYVIDYRESKDGKNWSKPRIVNVDYEDTTVRHWHLDVIHTPKGYEMDISAFPKNSDDHQHMSLYYTYSPDNVNYTKARVMLKPGKSKQWANRGLYRSCLLYDNGKYYLFYSGLNEKTGPAGIGMISGTNVFHME